MVFSPDMIVPLVAFLGYWLLAIFILARRRVRDNNIWFLMAYLGLSVIWTLGIELSIVRPLASWLRWDQITIYSGLGVAAALLLLALTFLQRWSNMQRWLLLGGLLLAVTILLDPDLLRLFVIGPWRVGERWLDQGDLHNIILALSWAFFTLALLIISWQEYRRARSPLWRNRIRYLLLAVTLTITGDGFYILGLAPYTQIAPLLKLGGGVAIAYATLSHSLPDIKQIYRQSTSYIIITLITSGIFLLGIWLPSTLFQVDLGLSATFGAFLVAVILALGYLPLRQAIQNLVDQFLFGKSYEYDHLLRNYGQRIADILDLERLTGVVIGIIDEALSIERGALLIAEGGDDGIGQVRLKPYKGLGAIPDESMEFRGSSPLLIHLRLKGLSITRYDLDFEPSFKSASQKERDCLRAMNVDVFVPVRAKERLIGILAVGAKRSGDSYFRDDLDLLASLADQTAVALENARLFQDLVMLNTVLSQAYTDLDKANRQLQEMDKLKSAFIGIVTHELRTPFANIDFSLQLLGRYAQENLSEEPREQLDELAAGIKSAKTMVDNLVTFASFIGKQGELRLAWLDFGKIVQDALLPLYAMAQAKDIAFQIAVPDRLPSLRGDQERLADAAYHLTQNAIKFTEPKGRVQARCWATADAIYFEVKDNGVGILADKLPSLWEDFTQMADPLRRGAEGLGLGLALVKYVIIAHGGEVWSQSEIGIGSTFGFQVPLGGPKPRTGPDLIQAARSDPVLPDSPQKGRTNIT